MGAVIEWSDGFTASLVADWPTDALPRGSCWLAGYAGPDETVAAVSMEILLWLAGIVECSSGLRGVRLVLRFDWYDLVNSALRTVSL